MDLARALAGRDPRRQFVVGRVVAYTAGGKTADVDVDGTTVTLPVLSSTAYAPGQTVLVARDGATAGWVLGAVGTAAAPPEVDPVSVSASRPREPGSVLRQRTATVVPTSTGTWRGGRWRDTRDLYQGDYGGYGLNLGAAFYGAALKGLHASMDRPRSVVLRYTRTRGGDFAARTPTVWTLAQRNRPAGAPTRLSSAVGPGVTTAGKTASASFTLPDAMADDLLTGAAGGLGIYVPGSTPYIVLAAPGQAAASMSLRVTYYT